MKKFIEFYDKLAEKLCNFGSDKYLHLLFGLLIGIFASLIFAVTTKGCMEISYATCGAIAATIVTLLKEIVDFFRGGNFDVTDWLFGTIGGIIGALLYLIIF